MVHRTDATRLLQAFAQRLAGAVTAYLEVVLAYAQAASRFLRSFRAKLDRLDEICIFTLEGRDQFREALA
jgi:hypothetical protein